jgi:hypothetical protein
MGHTFHSTGETSRFALHTVEPANAGENLH